MFKITAAVLLLISLVGGLATALVYGQSGSAEVDVRIRAKRLADGRTEFAIQQREGNTWSDSLFGSNPKLKPDPDIDRWYSSPIVTASAQVESTSNGLGMSSVASTPPPPQVGSRLALPMAMSTFA